MVAAGKAGLAALPSVGFPCFVNYRVLFVGEPDALFQQIMPPPMMDKDAFAFFFF